LGFSPRAKEILVASHFGRTLSVGRRYRPVARLCVCALYLHPILSVRVLGISAFYHDSAAALVENGSIIAAVQQERFTRRKHDPGFPDEAIAHCLKEAGCRLSELDFVVFYDKPFLKFERLLEKYLGFAPRGFRSFRAAMPLWLKQKLFQKDLLRRALTTIDSAFDWKNRLLFTEHHLSHAASAFLASPFEEAAILTMDGVGEWATTSLGAGRGNRVEIHREIHFPHSLGLLYSAFTYYTGFKVNSGEYKLMGLAPYGEPKFANLILDNLIDVKTDGSFRLDLSYFDYCTGLHMTNAKFAQLFGEGPRCPETDPLTQFHMDVAASIQAVTDQIVLGLARSARSAMGSRHLCLAGGVALNCVANGKILREGIFDKIWIQPAAGDAGGALGAALAGAHLFKGIPRHVNGGGDIMKGGYLGPEFAPEETKRRLEAVGARLTVVPQNALMAYTARALADQKAVRWMQGRMEFGPRALGNRL
jgi:carbamoyltransferase